MRACILSSHSHVSSSGVHCAVVKKGFCIINLHAKLIRQARPSLHSHTKSPQGTYSTTIALATSPEELRVFISSITASVHLCRCLHHLARTCNYISPSRTCPTWPDHFLTLYLFLVVIFYLST